MKTNQKFTLANGESSNRYKEGEYFFYNRCLNIDSGGFSHGSKGSMEPPFFADNLTDQPGPWHCVISKK